MSKESGYPAAKRAAYEKFMITKPVVERKGAAMRDTSVTGHMVGFPEGVGNLSLGLPTKRKPAKKAAKNRCRTREPRVELLNSPYRDPQ